MNQITMQKEGILSRIKEIEILLGVKVKSIDVEHRTVEKGAFRPMEAMINPGGIINTVKRYCT